MKKSIIHLSSLSSPLNKFLQGDFILKKAVREATPENYLKEQKLDLQSDRTSTHTFEGNQLRLWFTAIAYILLNNLGEKCLVNTELKNATIGTIRTKLLKLGAVITICKQRVLVLIAISSACPYKEWRCNDL